MRVGCTGPSCFFPKTERLRADLFFLPLFFFARPIGHVDSCPAGIDGLHPNALGDFQIARAYTKVLHERFGLGSGPLAVPPLEDIPGMKSIGSFRINPMNVLMYPPVGVFMVVSFLSLIFVMSLRPRWMRVRRTAEKKYQRLLLTRDGMEGL